MIIIALWNLHVCFRPKWIDRRSKIVIISLRVLKWVLILRINFLPLRRFEIFISDLIWVNDLESDFLSKNAGLYLHMDHN